MTTQPTPRGPHGMWARLRSGDPRARGLARRLGIVVMLLVVLAQPGYGRVDVPAQVSDLDVIVVVDRTRSMAAIDYQGGQPRLTGVRDDLQELAADLPGARFAMIAFGSTARLVLPLTTDTSAFDVAVQTIDLESPQEGAGSRASRPAAELAAVLDRAEEADPDRRRVVVYAGDGEDTSSGGVSPDAPDTDLGSVAQKISGGAVLGYGTEDGAPMLEDDGGLGSGSYVEDSRTGQSAISRADPDNLRSIADALGVPFRDRNGGGDMAGIADSLGGAYGRGGLGGGSQAAHDLTWLAGLALLALLLAELRVAWRTVWRAREELAEPTPGAPARGQRPERTSV